MPFEGNATPLWLEDQQDLGREEQASMLGSKVHGFRLRLRFGFSFSSATRAFSSICGSRDICPSVRSIAAVSKVSGSSSGRTYPVLDKENSFNAAECSGVPRYASSRARCKGVAGFLYTVTAAANSLYGERDIGQEAFERA